MGDGDGEVSAGRLRLGIQFRQATSCLWLESQRCRLLRIAFQNFKSYIDFIGTSFYFHRKKKKPSKEKKNHRIPKGNI